LRLLRRFIREGLFELSLKLLFGPLAAVVLLALEDLRRRRNFFPHQREPRRDSFPLSFFRCDGQ
jgi:hypothetical protein